MKSWTATGVVAVILAVGLVGAFSVAVIVAVLHGDAISDRTAGLLDNMGGLLAGALAGWLGGAAVERGIQRRTDDEQRDDEPPAA